MTGTFDVHEHRHRLKQLRDGGETTLFENRDGVVCPVCGVPFERVFSTRRSKTKFPESDGQRFCLLRDGAAVHLFRH